MAASDDDYRESLTTVDAPVEQLIVGRLLSCVTRRDRRRLRSRVLLTAPGPHEPVSLEEYRAEGGYAGWQKALTR